MTALRAGPRSAGDLKREAEAAGISERTLQRAKAMLGVVSNQIGTLNGGHEWQWSLPNTDVPAA
jgi:hypothetical protein